jgi:hypothetical protein
MPSTLIAAMPIKAQSFQPSIALSVVERIVGCAASISGDARVGAERCENGKPGDVVI